MPVILGLVEVGVERFFFLFLLERIVVSGRKRIDVHYTTVSKDLVVDKRREAITAKTETNVATSSGIEEASFRRVDTLEQLHGLTLLLEVDQVLVVLEDLDIGK